MNLIDIETYEKGDKRDSRRHLECSDGGSPSLPLNFMTWAEFNTTSEAFEKNGLALVDMESFGSGKTRCLSAFGGRISNCKIWAGADWNSYLGTWRTLQNAGYQLVDIEPTTSGAALTVTPAKPVSPSTPATSQPKIPTTTSRYTGQHNPAGCGNKSRVRYGHTTACNNAPNRNTNHRRCGIRQSILLWR
ncbi:MAG: hypothetical protein R3C26_17200 [Calditrichia bacterium]